jgi:hypothetical protein
VTVVQQEASVKKWLRRSYALAKSHGRVRDRQKQLQSPEIRAGIVLQAVCTDKKKAMGGLEELLTSSKPSDPKR